MKKEIAGIPVWIYAIGAAVVIGGYLWIRHQQSTSASSGTPGQGTGGQGKSTSSISEQITEWQSSPGGGSGGQGAGKGPGPEGERDYLQHWTGSGHPWTWLHTHSRKSV